MSILLIALVTVWAISGIALIVLVLMHSGKGTGLSEAFSGIQSSVGTGIIEKNLTRMTIIAASIFVLTLVGMMLAWPV
ncbi:MAG: preprotein translocase subunit SecG [Coriobacteriia bacterium]|nr:preprotein translocase subunit SecG [Coriobacteriia bacterium]MCL2870750.1 preprotein translocase subunit SecG [Coriobacteriia bacterium]